mmetsp:Transcript_40522/g.114793  ORF Transcript_40522/g.114793 Transcript_40522/m.114793 type:complete len:526 (+) Transcript_40522:220-1797(+)
MALQTGASSLHWVLVLLVSHAGFSPKMLSVEGAIHGYKGQPFTHMGNAYVFKGGREGLFASTNQAQSGFHAVNKKVSDGTSYIRLANMEFLRPWSVANHFRMLDGQTGLVEALVFEVGERDLVGHVGDDGERQLCCSRDLAAQLKCTPNRIIVKKHANAKKNTPWLSEIHFDGNLTSAFAPATAVLPITETGMFHLLFVVCDPELKGIRAEGHSTWKNPHGFLPGMMVGNLRFYGYMSLAMLCLAFAWLVLYCYHWRDIIPLQHCISILIALCMTEASIWYFDYVNFNTTGFRPHLTTLWAVLLGSLRKCLARIVILVVSMGYGVVRPTLGGLTKTVWAMGLAYFAAVSMLDMVTHVGTIDDLPSMVRLFLVMPVSVLDAVFILWIFTALSRTLTQLGARRKEVKLNLYRKFTNTLAIAVWVSVLFTAYEMYLKVRDSTHTEKWQMYWVADAFWQVLNFCVLCIICVLWRPSKNSQCYSYTEADADIDIEEVGLVDVDPSGESFPKANTDVFSIAEDDEEESKMA